MMKPFYDPLKYPPFDAGVGGSCPCLLLIDVNWDGDVFMHESDLYLPHTNRDIIGWRPGYEKDVVSRVGNMVYLDATAEELTQARLLTATQKALDKANRDNEALRTALTIKDLIINDLRHELTMANASLRAALDPKRLVDGGEGYYEAWSAAGGE